MIQPTQPRPVQRWNPRVASLPLTLVLLTGASPARAQVELQLTARSVPSPSDVATGVPSSQSVFVLGSSIFVEVWAQTTQANGLSSASLDLSFAPSLATAAGVGHSPLFSTLTHSVINNPSGVIDDLSGSHLGPCSDAIAVAPAWGRVAVVEFTADAAGPLMIQALTAGSPVYGTAVCGVGDVDPSQIQYGSIPLEILPVDIPTVSQWGLLILALGMAIAGVLVIRKHRPQWAH